MKKQYDSEILRFEIEDLIYNAYLFVDGEVRFTVTGDNIRLGVLTDEDLSWDFTFDLPVIQTTDEVVKVHVHSLHVLRRIVFRYAQYIDRNRPFYVYYRIPSDPRLERVCMRLMERYARTLSLYNSIRDEEVGCVTFTRKPPELEPL